MSDDFCLLTPTWADDRAHFGLLRASIERSPFHSIPHEVVAQTEDLELFRPVSAPPVRLRSTAEVLPVEVETMRQRAKRLQARMGRGGTRILGSLARHSGWPAWVAYTGWHVQQITKLALVAASDVDHVVAIDSDVVVTPHATAEDFLAPGRVVCFERLTPVRQVSRKVWNWNRQAHVLFDRPFPADDLLESYFDTPFVFHAPTVRRMLNWLEDHYRCPWWQALLRQPPRRWSEFGSYRVFLRMWPPDSTIEWRSDHHMRYIFDASDLEALVGQVEALLKEPGSHYITIHSQSSGRQLWSATGYADRILALLPEPRSGEGVEQGTAGATER